MKKLVNLAVILFFISLAGCKTSSSESENQSDSLSLNTNAKTEFHVKGMHCTGCENTIKINVKELKGISSVEASFKENIAVVAFDSLLTNETAIISAINTAGYQVDTFIRK